MKKIYKAPETEVVKIKLVGSVLQEVGFNNNNSMGATGGNVPARGFSFFDEEETSDDIWSKEEE